MNRQQAEHLLDAYMSAKYSQDAGGGSDASKVVESLRQVILDTMTETRYFPYYVNAPQTQPYRPTITWTGDSI